MWSIAFLVKSIFKCFFFKVKFEVDLAFFNYLFANITMWLNLTKKSKLQHLKNCI